jgi:hypothetical protein
MSFVRLYVGLFGVILIVVACTRTDELDITAYLRGSTEIIVRIPKGNQPSEDIIIRHAEPTQSKWAVRSLVGDTEYNSIIQLTESDWMAIRALYTSWCQKRPQFSANPPYYTVAIQCGVQQFIIHIPREELPIPFVKLNETVPPVKHQIDGATPTPR